MNFLWNKITEWIKGLLISGIMSNLNGLFDGLNGQVAEIAGTVGTTPQGWNGSVFNMIKSLSDNVIVPIAGAILTFVMCYELIQMVIDKNSFHDFETTMAASQMELGYDIREVTDEVFSGRHSKVFDEAENRMHTIKAVIVATIA